MNIILAFGAQSGSNFQDSATATVDVGSTANRAAFVLIGTDADSSPTPSSVTVGSDTLTTASAQFTGAAGKWRLYAGSLTVTGSQTVTATLSSNAGWPQMIGLIVDGVDSGVIESVATFAKSFDPGGIPPVKIDESATSGDAGDIVAVLVATASNSTWTEGSGVTQQTGTGIGDGTIRNVFTKAGAAGSVTITADSAGVVGGGGVVFNIPALAAAPTLSSPTATATGLDRGLVGVTTDTGSGTLYVSVTTSATQPSGAQIEAGQDHTGSAAVYASSQAVSSTGDKTFTATGLSSGTTYYAHFRQTSGSNVVSSSGFTPGNIRMGALIFALQ